MARYVHPDIESARDDPSPDSVLDVILVVERGTLRDVAEQVSKTSASVEREFDTDMLLVATPEAELSTLCDLDFVESVSPDGQMEALA